MKHPDTTMSPVRERPAVHVVMPAGVDDTAAPSGGNIYDRRVCRDLPSAGRHVYEHLVAGAWPQPDAAARGELARILAQLADGTVVLLDGLLACAVPGIVVPEAARLRLAVLVHLPLGDETGLTSVRAAELDALERRTLRAVPAVVATSGWAARRLVAHHGLDAARVHVAAPGADPAPLAPGTDGASRLLCVASVTPRKAQHRLVEALAAVDGLPWSCHCVGSLHHDPGYAARLRTRAEEAGLGDRVHFIGPLAGEELAASYAAADLLVLTSRAETYGMVVTEALARGIPVLATAVDGLPEAVGRAPDGSVPGLLVPDGDPDALTSALRSWLAEPALRRRLRQSARDRRAMLHGWEKTSQSLARVLETLRREPPSTA